VKERVEHLIIGAGFGGLCTAIKLQEDGERDFLVIEKAADVGGTWRDNTYPGAACDVPSQLYSLSFAPNPDWSMSFSPQPEIQAYLKRVADESGTLDRFVFDTLVESAQWDDQAYEWVVETSRGTVRANTLISAAGGLSEPRLPDIEGLGEFEGAIFHSARWDHGVDLTGKRIAVIGTGASAIQIVPELQKVAAHLDVYQRSAPYVMPRNDRAYSKAERFLFRHVPAVRKAYRAGIYWGRECYVPGFAINPKLAAPAKKMALKNLTDHVSDPDLVRRLTPSYDIGCKRILISNTYFPAIAAPNVDLVTDRIARVTATGIATTEGTQRPVDVIVVATGFHTTDLPIAERLTGRTGQTLAQTWQASGMQAYKGTTVRGFPNLFFIVGPNTGLGHSSMVHIIESQVAYIRECVGAMRRNRYAAIEPTEQAVDAWNGDVQKRLTKSVWNTGGCSSWYLDEHGKNTVLWPRTTFKFRSLLAHWDPEAYEVSAAPVVEERPARQPVVEEGTARQPVVEEGTARQPVVEEGTARQPVVEEGTARHPVVEEGAARLETTEPR
jgi:cation diffusion facilitator CzcD-associated flavoprotein CzcO